MGPSAIGQWLSKSYILTYFYNVLVYLDGSVTWAYSTRELGEYNRFRWYGYIHLLAVIQIIQSDANNLQGIEQETIRYMYSTLTLKTASKSTKLHANFWSIETLGLSQKMFRVKELALSGPTIAGRGFVSEGSVNSYNWGFVPACSTNLQKKHNELKDILKNTTRTLSLCASPTS